MQIVVTDPDSLPVARREVDAELDAVEAAASRFRPDSEINALAASSGRPTEVSELLAELLDAALTAARQTDGDVDPTIGAAMIALGYDRDIATLECTRRTCRVDQRSGELVDGHARGSRRHRAARGGSRPRSDGQGDRRGPLRRACSRATGTGVLINLGGDIATAGPATERWLAGIGPR